MGVTPVRIIKPVGVIGSDTNVQVKTRIEISWESGAMLDYFFLHRDQIFPVFNQGRKSG